MARTLWIVCLLVIGCGHDFASPRFAYVCTDSTLIIPPPPPPPDTTQFSATYCLDSLTYEEARVLDEYDFPIYHQYSFGPVAGGPRCITFTGTADSGTMTTTGAVISSPAWRKDARGVRQPMFTWFVLDSITASGTWHRTDSLVALTWTLPDRLPVWLHNQWSFGHQLTQVLTADRFENRWTWTWYIDYIHAVYVWHRRVP